MRPSQKSECRMRKWGILCVGALLIALVTPGARAQSATTRAAKPNTAVAADTCATAGCHAEVKQFKVVHGPVNVNACDACHKLVDPAQHKYELTRDKTETCTFCHKLDLHGDKVIHKPVAEGQCLGCHNPHGGTTAKFIRGKNMQELCVRCHQDVRNKKFVHGPIAAGACEACHKSHSATLPKLLVAQGQELCFSCHSEMKQKMTTVKVKHKAVEQDCMNCHDPHASDFTMQTKQAPVALCTGCHEHEPIKKAAVNAKFKHDPVVQGDACLNCHTAHGGDLAKLMKAEQLKICMKCHSQKIEVQGRRPVAPVTEVLDPKLTKHGPAADGTCGGCHNVHGADVSRLLRKEYPEVFYQGFAADKYDLCFTCHNKELVTAEKTTGLTQFRNGDRSLHFAHVNKSDRGRSCRACHATHAAASDRLVRETVPYGNWQMPLNYQRTNTGGSCSPGCHKPFAYDRDKPVTHEAPQATPNPNPTATQPAGAKDNK